MKLISASRAATKSRSTPDIRHRSNHAWIRPLPQMNSSIIRSTNRMLSEFNFNFNKHFQPIQSNSTKEKFKKFNKIKIMKTMIFNNNQYKQTTHIKRKQMSPYKFWYFFRICPQKTTDYTKFYPLQLNRIHFHSHIFESAHHIYILTYFYFNLENYL